MIADKLGYASVAAGVGKLVKAGPAGFFGVSVLGAGNVLVYDGTSASGTLIYSYPAAPVGFTANFGGNGIACKVGLFVATVGDAVVLYT